MAVFEKNAPGQIYAIFWLKTENFHKKQQQNVKNQNFVKRSHSVVDFSIRKTSAWFRSEILIFNRKKPISTFYMLGKIQF